MSVTCAFDDYKNRNSFVICLSFCVFKARLRIYIRLSGAKHSLQTTWMHPGVVSVRVGSSCDTWRLIPVCDDVFVLSDL
jgi:hypothetical protein